MMQTIKTAIIGLGYLGKFHAEKLAAIPNSRLTAVCDTDHKRAQAIAEMLKVPAITDYRALAATTQAVIVAVPTPLHYEVASFFLAHGIHVLVEKPITTTVDEADKLIMLANKNGCVLQVGHLERFNPAIIALKPIVKNPGFIESYRLAPFKSRNTDVNVVLDLMIHDIDLIQNIINAPIKKITAIGAPVLTTHMDIANARIEFTNHCTANVTASRVSFKTERKLRIFQPNAYISADLHNKKLSLYRKGEKEMFPGIPEIISGEQEFKQSDALHDEIIDFLQAIIHKRAPVVSGEDGKKALITAIAITDIIESQNLLDKLN